MEQNNPIQADIAFSYAPGKIILVGEHAVVYGAKAIAMPLDRGIRVALSKNTQLNKGQFALGPIFCGGSSGVFSDVWPDPAGHNPKLFQKALSYLDEHYGPHLSSLHCLVDSAIPAGRGLGSSASLAVALLKGLHRYLDIPLSESLLLERALAMETIFHGKPSGIDHTAVALGKVIGFQKTHEKAKSWEIPLQGAYHFAIGLAGSHGGTIRSVQALKDRLRLHTKTYESLFLGLDQLASECEQQLLLGRKASVGELMNVAQGYLNALGVSTPELESLCGLARYHGALGAKLTGAGGGGAVIALADGDASPIAKAFQAAGYFSFTTTIGGRDVKDRPYAFLSEGSIS